MTAILLICVSEKPETPGKGISTETSVIEPLGCTEFELTVINAFEKAFAEWLEMLEGNAKERAEKESE